MDLVEVMARLAQRRPVFHSEADFQHELAWEIRRDLPDASIRLELPISGSTGRGALDVLLISQGTRVGIELKYVKAPMTHSIEGEEFRLVQHAYDFAAYDCCKDVERLEHLMGSGQIDFGYLIVLTNHAPFWKVTGARPSFLDVFALRDETTLSGTLSWPSAAGPGTTRKRESPICLTGAYGVRWRDYSRLDATRGHFRFVMLEVKEGALLTTQ